MAEPIAQQAQVFESSLLDLVTPAGRPKYMGVYQTSNQLLNALAHLAGQDGLYSRLLACDENGALKVQAAALDEMAAWDIGAIAANLALIAACDFVVYPTTVSAIQDTLGSIYAMLTDVWDSASHAIRTTSA